VAVKTKRRGGPFVHRRRSRTRDRRTEQTGEEAAALGMWAIRGGFRHGTIGVGASMHFSPAHDFCASRG
jgi:hypothetical protein